MCASNVTHALPACWTLLTLLELEAGFRLHVLYRRYDVEKQRQYVTKLANRARVVRHLRLVYSPCAQILVAQFISNYNQTSVQLGIM